MKEKRISKILMIGIAVFLITALGAPELYAGHGRGCSWGKSGHHPYGKAGKDLSYKLVKKVKFLKLYQDEIGLSDEQIETIGDIKYNWKKDMIQKEAQVEDIKLDIHHELYERNVDVAAINPLIDKKYEVKKAKSKGLIQAFADLKNVLTDEQYAKMKKIWRDKKKFRS